MSGLPREAGEFVSSREDVQGVVQRIGGNNTQLILVAKDGEWLRFVTNSPDEARRFATTLKIEVHDGYPEHLRQAMGSYRRPDAEIANAPYPERDGASST